MSDEDLARQFDKNVTIDDNDSTGFNDDDENDKVGRETSNLKNSTPEVNLQVDQKHNAAAANVQVSQKVVTTKSPTTGALFKGPPIHLTNPAQSSLHNVDTTFYVETQPDTSEDQLAAIFLGTGNTMSSPIPVVFTTAAAIQSNVDLHGFTSTNRLPYVSHAPTRQNALEIEATSANASNTTPVTDVRKRLRSIITNRQEEKNNAIDLYKIIEPNFDTCLHHAAMEATDDGCRRLEHILHKMQMDQSLSCFINFNNKVLHTPLSLAVKYNNLGAIELLLNFGARTTAIIGDQKSRCNVFHYAVLCFYNRKSSFETICFLFSKTRSTDIREFQDSVTYKNLNNESPADFLSNIRRAVESECGINAQVNQINEIMQLCNMYRL